MENKNPAILALIPSVISTIVSIVKDKKEKKEQAPIVITDTPGTAVPDKVIDAVKDLVGKGAEAAQLSSKRILNVVGAGIIVTFALGDMGARGINGMNLAVLCIGVLYSVAMTIATVLAEKK